jgi:ParB-like chromosome segregation protein Spo0J
MSRDIIMPIALDDIDVPNGRREVVAATVKRLADSIEKVGLRHPITVRRKGERYELVAGRHRMEACRKLGREHVPSCIVTMNKTEARLWEIAENLHRADLTKLERDEQVAEWIKLTDDKPVQSEQVSKGGRGNEGGVSAASRELGVQRTDAVRALQVASLTEEAKEAARETGLDNNRSALLKAAKKPVGEQVATIHRIHQAKVAADPLSDGEALEQQVAAIMAAWNKASKEAREEFLLRIESPVMDQRFSG